MPSSSPPPSSSSRRWLDKIDGHLGKLRLPDDCAHPTHIALRTYLLALSLSLGPSLIPVVTTLVKGLLLHDKTSARTAWNILKKALRRELGHDGFAFTTTLAVGGGSAVSVLWDHLAEDSSDVEGALGDKESSKARLYRLFCRVSRKLSSYQRGFLSFALTSSIACLLLQAGRNRSRRLLGASKKNENDILTFPLPYTPPTTAPTSNTSPTLDLTLLLVVRALDVVVQSLVRRQCHATEEGEEGQPSLKSKIASLTTNIDAFAFWACSARIMWCFFYEPQRLPQSYVRWIGALAAVDKRLLNTLRHLRQGDWTYGKGSVLSPTNLSTYASDLGYPKSWGDPSQLPATGITAQHVWEKLGVVGREGRGGIPCELVHAGAGRSLGLEASCVANSGIRGFKAFLEALAIYLPVHLLPILLMRPSSLLNPRRALAALMGACRSATFLSTFVSSYYFMVCFTRTLALARILPQVSHMFWDGPYGCVLAGCLTCGGSIWIENGRRRGEMALYVLPRAIRTCIPEGWVKSKNKVFRNLERSAFVLSLAFLLMSAKENGDSLRGMARWVLTFMLNGPHAGFWQKKQDSLVTRPGTPQNENEA